MGGPRSLICWLRAWAAAQHQLGLRAGIGRRVNRPLVSTRGWRECEVRTEGVPRAKAVMFPSWCARVQCYGQMAELRRDAGPNALCICPRPRTRKYPFVKSSRLSLAFGLAALGLVCLMLDAPHSTRIAAAGQGEAAFVALAGSGTAGSGGLPLAGTVTLEYRTKPPAAGVAMRRPSSPALPLLAADGDAAVTSTATSINSSASSAAFAPDAAGDIEVKRLDALCPDVASGCTVGGDQPPVYSDASANVASSGNKLFQVFESFAARSVDNGETWGYVNPNTAFPNGAAPEFQAGFWGRQRLAQDPSRGLIIWVLQYGYAAGMDANGIRFAVANAGADLSTAPTQTWSYYDVTGATLGTRAGMGIEVHQLEVSTDWAYLSVNVFDSQASTAVNGGIIRLSLDGLATGAALAPGDVQFYNPPDAPASAKTFSMIAVNGATDTMFFGSVSGETSFRVIRWKDDSAAPEAATEITNLEATKDPGPNLWECPGPDLLNPCGLADSRGQSGWVTTAFGGEVGFLWNSDRRPAQGRPLPFVRALVLNSGDLSVKSQPDLFTDATDATNFAWIYPSVAVNSRGHLAGTVTVTPGPATTAAPQAPAMWGFLRDDLSADGEAATGWDTFSIATGTNGPELNSWGAWSGAARHAQYGNTWLLAGQIMVGSGDDASTRPQNAWVMRARDDPDFRDLARDTDCNGSVNSADSLAVLRAMAGFESGILPVLPCTGDANASSGLDIDDARRIRMAAAGLT